MSDPTTAELRASALRMPDRVVSAAARMIERDGYDGASMREIADEAGMTKPGLYYHAPSKDLLLFAIHDRFATQLLERAEQVLAAGGSAADRLRAVIRLNLETVAEFRAEGTVFLREYWHLTGELREVIDAQRNRFRRIYVELIEEGIGSGEFSPGDAEVDALAVLGACNFSAIWLRTDGRLSTAELSDAFADRLIGGLRVRNED